MKVINLNSRYGNKHKLEHLGGNCWQLVLDPKSPQTYRCIGCGDANSSKLYAIDPDGGPFLSVGSTIENYTITDISSNGIIWMKENNVSN